jgi:2-haloacid dehalogenase
MNPSHDPTGSGAIAALIFDVFGTLVDWRSGVAREAERVLGARGVAVDALAFADAWRAQYQPAMERIRGGGEPYRPLDVLHRANLDRVLDDLGLSGRVDEAARADLNLAWHRLDAWPDVTAALRALRPRFRLAPCSNGNIALMVDLARRNGWSWDAVLGADVARDYKPKAAVYQASAAALGCEPAAVLMVAAHSDDLAFAAKAGLRTAHIARPDEKGKGRGEAAPKVPVDFAAADLADLATRLGVARA